MPVVKSILQVIRDIRHGLTMPAQNFTGLSPRLYPLLMILPLIAWLILSATPVLADGEKSNNKYANVKTKVRYSVGIRCAKQLEKQQKKIRTFAEGKSTKNLTAVIAELKSLPSKTCKTSHEKSQVYNLIGYSAYLQENNAVAINYYSKMMAEPEVDTRAKTSTRLTVAQLYFIQENYKKSVQQLTQWLKKKRSLGEKPAPQQLIMLAQAYYELGNHKSALGTLNKAITEYQKQGKRPKENWWVLQAALYSESRQYTKAIAVFKKLLTHHPKSRYWKQLNGLFSQLNQTKKQLAVTELLDLQNMLSSQQDILSLVYLYSAANAPFDAAKVLDNAIKNKRVTANLKNYTTLGNNWVRAKELTKAIAAYQQAASLSSDGRIDARLAATFLDANNNKKAVQYAKKALEKGGLKTPQLTQFNMGSALVNLHCYKQAEPVFNAVSQHKKYGKAARQWAQFVRQEQNRFSQLQESGATVPTCGL